jgi:ferrous iron transport protein A
MTIADLNKGEIAQIIDCDDTVIPLKLMEMGCLPNQKVKILQLALYNDPIYLEVNGSYIAIRKETAKQIQVKQL